MRYECYSWQLVFYQHNVPLTCTPTSHFTHMLGRRAIVARGCGKRPLENLMRLSLTVLQWCMYTCKRVASKRRVYFEDPLLKDRDVEDLLQTKLRCPNPHDSVPVYTRSDIAYSLRLETCDAAYWLNDVRESIHVAWIAVKYLCDCRQ